MSAWVLPDHIADVLPSEARHLEELRRRLLDTASAYGYELLMPPLIEYLDSLLTGTGEALDLQTFKLVDQISGRTMGLRADTTPQVARIDAHLLNRQSVTRLCYCGPVVHTHQSKPHASREQLQFGSELYGHAGLEADLEIQDLALTCLQAAGISDLVLDLTDVRIVRHLLLEVEPGEQRMRLQQAVANKDKASIQTWIRQGHVQGLLPHKAQALLHLLDAYGDARVLQEARAFLPQDAVITQALDDLQSLAQAVAHRPGLRLSFDLASFRAYDYYSGVCFALYTPRMADAVARGGRYDEVGAVFGRKRPAVGFSLDLKDVVALLPRPAPKAAIRAPWQQDPALQQAIAQLRAQGEVVVCSLPGHEHEVDEFDCDRVLVQMENQWVLTAL